MKPIRLFPLLLSLSALTGVRLLAEPATTTDDAAPPGAAVSAPAPETKSSTAVPPRAATEPPAQVAPATEDPEDAKIADHHDEAPPAPAAQPAPESPAATEKSPAPTPPHAPEAPTAPRPNDGGTEVAGLGNAHLARGNNADAVVAIFGNAEAHGNVHEAVVAVLGNSTASENVGQAVVAVLGNSTAEKEVGQDVVAVLGDARANGHVHGNVVAVLGNVDLGPSARVDGDVVSVGGIINRAPGSEVHGKVNQVAFLHHVPLVSSLGYWFQQTIGHGRLLGLHSRIGGAWGVASAFLVLYLLISLAFGNAVTKCAETLEQRPGRVVLTAFLSFLVAPLLMIPLTLTIIGLIVFLVALVAALIVGKASFLAWLGRRLGGTSAKTHVTLAVLIGGLLTLLLYAVPIVGLLLWSVGTALGFGMAVSTAMIGMRRERGSRSTAAPFPTPPAPPSAVPVSPAVPPGIVAAPAQPVAPASAPSSPASVSSPAATVAASNPEVAPSTASVAAAATSSGAAASAAAMPMVGNAIPPVPPMPPLPKSVRPVGPAAGPVSTVELPRAGFWIRLAASGLDVVLVGVLGHIAHVGDYFLLLFTAYCLVMWALRATTIGGIVCGLKIVRLDERPVDWPVALVRVLGAFLSLCVAGLGFMWVAFDPEMQSWHDKIAGTTIVRLPKGTPLI